MTYKVNTHHIRREEVFTAHYCWLSFIFAFGFHVSETFGVEYVLTHLKMVYDRLIV